jgi:hypothetical protein
MSTADPIYSLVKNIPLLEKVYDHVVAHPEEWDQELWSNMCGTQFCFAGHTVMISRPDVRIMDGDFITEDGEVLDPQVEAQSLLGLNYHEMYNLFYNTKTDLDDLTNIIESIKDNRCERE